MIKSDLLRERVLDAAAAMAAASLAHYCDSALGGCISTLVELPLIAAQASVCGVQRAEHDREHAARLPRRPPDRRSPSSRGRTTGSL